jgi:hypothetical protein
MKSELKAAWGYTWWGTGNGRIVTRCWCKGCGIATCNGSNCEAYITYKIYGRNDNKNENENENEHENENENENENEHENENENKNECEYENENENENEIK